MQRIVSMAALVSAVLFAACARPTLDLEAEAEALKQLSRDWSTRAATGNLDTILAVWADDAVLLAPGTPPLQGKAAIRGYVDAAMRIPGFKISWEPQTVEVARSGDLAYMLEQNVTTVNDSSGKPVTTYGRGVTVWRKDADGKWRNVVDIWNEAPPPAGKP